MKRFAWILLGGLLCVLPAWAQKPVKVACVGNSITYGYGLKDRLKEAYPVQLQQLLGPGYEVGNFGKSGATLLDKGHRPYKQQPAFREALAFAPDVVVIHLGINDTDPRNWPHYRDEFVKDYLSLIDAFRDQNPACRILVARMTPIAHRHPRFESGTRDWHEQIQRTIETVARLAGAQLMDFHAPLYPYPYLLPDAIHPNAEGAKRLAQVVYSSITGDWGGLQLSPMYTDHMVLQREVPLEIKGLANAGEKVTVTLAGQRTSVQARADGTWKVTLSPLAAGGPHVLTVATAQKKLRFEDVLVGEVWLCSGQSNMEFRLKESAGARSVIAASDNDQLRFYDMKARWLTRAVAWKASVLDSLNHLDYYHTTRWQTASPETSARFSAVAYAFGKLLQDSLQVPVGLICNAVGGSPAEAWIDRSTLEKEFPAILRDWRHNDFIQDWVRGRASLNIRSTANPLQRHPYEPCYLFEAGILPLQQYPIRGVIWYQGESNAHNIEAHEKLFPLLVRSWRQHWQAPALPFYYVQLSSLNRPSWPWFRDSQRRMMATIPHVGMAVSSDWGDSLNVHPVVKQPIGERLARWALHQQYDWKQVVPSGPLFRSVHFQREQVWLSFDYADGLKTADGQPLRTMEIAEVDGCYYPAQATIQGNRVVVSHPAVKRPRYVRYGWQPFTRANLVNAAGLPASTFRAEAPASFLASWNLQEMNGFPKDDKGFRQGVSASFAACLDGQLLLAGGCNFPDVPACEGGKKKYYSTIYLADVVSDTVLQWRKVGRLPQPTAYGVSVSTPDGMICIGGMNEKGRLKEVYRVVLDARSRKATIVGLPSLPFALDNMCGALVGDYLFVAGGNCDGKPSHTLVGLDLRQLDKGWEVLPSFPGAARTQPVCVAQLHGDDKRFYLWGGFAPRTDGHEPTLSLDGYMYSTKSRTWSPLPAPIDACGETVSLGGGVAFPLNNQLILFTGGVHKDIFLNALRATPDGYLSHPAPWYRFNGRALLYHLDTQRWEEVTVSPLLARAGAVLVGKGQELYYINGELKPGIRTPSIVKLHVESARNETF